MSEKKDMNPVAAIFLVLSVILLMVALMFMGFLIGVSDAVRYERQKAVDAGVAEWVTDHKGQVDFRYKGK